METKFVHVHSHTDIISAESYWNDKADGLANAAYDIIYPRSTSIPYGAEEYILVNETGHYIDGRSDKYMLDEGYYKHYVEVRRREIVTFNNGRTSYLTNTLRYNYEERPGSVGCSIWTEVTRRLLITLPSHLSVFNTAIRVGEPVYNKQFAVYKGSLSQDEKKCACGTFARHLWKHAQVCGVKQMVEARKHIAECAAMQASKLRGEQSKLFFCQQVCLRRKVVLESLEMPIVSAGALRGCHVAPVLFLQSAKMIVIGHEFHKHGCLQSVQSFLNFLRHIMLSKKQMVIHFILQVHFILLPHRLTHIAVDVPAHLQHLKENIFIDYALIHLAMHNFTITLSTLYLHEIR